MPSAEDLDAVTVDAMGTLVELDAPVDRLAQALQDRGAAVSATTVADAFQAEVSYYLEHKLSARDDAGLAALRLKCSRVFLEQAGTDLDPAEFTPSFVDAMVFTPLEGAVAALDRVRGAGLALACVSDWDIGLESQLEGIGLDHLFDLVLTSAEAGAAKPDPALFREALARLAVDPERAVHVGNGEADRDGAAAAGIAFEPVPLATVPQRLGIR
jgi:putative hydrolase of the HAD superfamily